MRRQDVNPAVKGPLMLLVLGLALLALAPTRAGQLVGFVLTLIGAFAMAGADRRPAADEE